MRAASLSLEDDLDDIARLVDEWTDAGFEYLVCGWPAEAGPRSSSSREVPLTLSAHASWRCRPPVGEADEHRARATKNNASLHWKCQYWLAGWNCT